MSDSSLPNRFPRLIAIAATLDALDQFMVGPTATPEYEQRLAELMDGITPLPSLLQSASPEPPALPPSENKERPAVLALLRVFTNGVADERFQRAAQILADDTLTANDKLTRIDELIRFPPTASAEQLGEMLGVSKQAILKTAWWCKNRQGMTDVEIERRRSRMKERGQKFERPRPDEGDAEGR